MWDSILLNLFVHISQSFQTERRDIFTHSLQYIEIMVNRKDYFSPEDKMEILDYCRVKNNINELNTMFYHSTSSNIAALSPMSEPHKFQQRIT